jgi:hypothetical protein
VTKKIGTADGQMMFPNPRKRICKGNDVTQGGTQGGTQDDTQGGTGTKFLYHFMYLYFVNNDVV